MFDWDKLLAENLNYVDPGKLGCCLQNELADSLWQIEPNIFAKTFSNSTNENPLVASYYWAPDQATMLWMASGTINSNVDVATLSDVAVPNIWPYVLVDLRTYEPIKERLDSLDVFNLPYSRHDGFITLAFERTRLFFVENHNADAALFGFQIRSINARVGNGFLFA